MSVLTRTFAAEAGYHGDSPALLSAYEAIRQSAIRETRKAHRNLKNLVDQYKSSPEMFRASIWPSLSIDEAIEDARHVLANHKNMSTWMRQRCAGEARRAEKTILMARFFRRYGERVWIREAA